MARSTGLRVSSTRTEIVKCTNTHFTVFHTKRIVVDEKISLNVIRRTVRPAWTEGVPTSAPLHLLRRQNRSALWGLTKLQ
jgi:hypothetical protein